MKLGVLMFATDYAIRPDELARACEERGFESVWFPEHTHIPVSRRSPWPVGGNCPATTGIPMTSLLPSWWPPPLPGPSNLAAAFVS